MCIGTDTWFTCADAPRARYRHAAANINNKLYLTGGRDVTDTIVSEIDVYDPSTDTWEANAYIWATAVSDQGAFGYNGDIYIAGGWDSTYTPTDQLVKYNPVARNVTILPSMPGGSIFSL